MGMTTEQKERSALCNKLAFNCWKKLEPDLKEIAELLQTSMEISHFLSCLDNRLAISIAMKFNVKPNPLKDEQ